MKRLCLIGLVCVVAFASLACGDVEQSLKKQTNADDWSTATRTQFLATCAAQGPTVAECRCPLEEVESVMSESELYTEELFLISTGQYSPRMVSIMLEALSKCD